MVVRTRRGAVRDGAADAQLAAGSGGSSAATGTPPAPRRASRVAKRARPAESSGVDGGASDHKRKQRTKAVATPAEQEAVDETQHKITASVSKPSEAAGDSTKKMCVPLDDECSTCEPGAGENASAGEDARQMDGGKRSQVNQQQQKQQQQDGRQEEEQEQEEEEEEDGAWPSEDDDDKGEFYCSDASQREQSDALFCTRQAVCLDEEARRVRQQEEVREVAELLGVDESCAMLLLRSAAWNKEALLSNYMDDADKVCAAAGVPGPSTSLSAVKRSQLRKDFECRICRSDGELSVSSLACGHDFCDTCWEQFLTLKTDGGDVHICCPEPSCSLQVPSELVKRLCSEAINAKFHGFLLDSFVNDSKTSVWCPQPGCGLAVDSATAAGQGKFVTCGQGHSFCLECKHEAHAPASCDCVKKWLQKCDDDSETFNWLAANTQDCPKCSSTIEKNGGCNHMTCRQCKYEFCWVCRGAWSLHGDAYSCNRWQDDGALKEKEGTRQASRAALDRYLFYYHRYNNHELSRRLDQQNNARAAAKMAEIQELEPDRLWGDVQFVAEATVGLAACRLVLKWTYVLAHSLVDNSAEKNLFCFLQEDLESKTEQLSGLLESDVEKIMTPEIRNRVLNLSSVAAQSRRKLLRGVDEGLGGGGGAAAAAGGGGSSFSGGGGGGGGGGSTSAAATAASA